MNSRPFRQHKQRCRKATLSPVGADFAESATARDDDDMRAKYLHRIGIPPQQADALVAKGPSVDLIDLQDLLTAHLFSVPFENLDQHSHPADTDNIARGASHIPRRQIEDLPSLDVHKSLRKICNDRRGGFCYELNTSFAWLLRSLGFNVRLAVADVGCAQAIPAHVIVLVDGLLEDTNASVLVDVGFGTPGVCDVVLPLVHNNQTLDKHGDSFRFVHKEGIGEDERFDTILYRKRLVTGNPHDNEEPMYRFHSKDDLPNDAPEFAKGLHHVLNHSPTFTGKRLCVISTEGGHCTLGEGYVKWMERGEAVRVDEFETETQWREALEEHFGVVLRR